MATSANNESKRDSHDVERASLLLVDDDHLIVDSLSFVLGDEFDIVSAETRQQAKTKLQSMEHAPLLALVDLGLPPTPHRPEQGYALIQELLAINQNMKILVLSGQSDRANIQHALTLGAVDFVPKPCDADLLRTRLRHQLLILDAEQAQNETYESSEHVLRGDSQAMQTLRALVSQFADNPFPVLIEGESGCGKELVAECLHRERSTNDSPFVTLNCAAFTADLLEAQLFGHAKGAFTGAAEQRAGFFEEAGEGTLFLDEVGEMPLALQTKFLRVLENGEYYRLGETRPRHATARVIAATNRDLRDAVSNGSFRQDLFHRLSVLSIVVPPLRARDDDWSELLQFFQKQYADTIKPFSMTDDARAMLANYTFPGNVRELRNIVIRLGAKYPAGVVDRDAIAAELESQVAFDTSTLDSDDVDPNLIERLTSGSFSLDDELAESERRIIRAALNLTDGNLSKAARLLGVNRTTLYSRVSRLGLTENEE